MLYSFIPALEYVIETQLL